MIIVILEYSATGHKLSAQTNIKNYALLEKKPLCLLKSSGRSVSKC